MERRRRWPHRGAPWTAGVGLAGLALVAAACGNGDPPPPELASPSAACAEAFAAAADAGERPEPEQPRSPDIDLLRDTLDACASSDEWFTAARANPGALPLELDRETALDELCGGNPDTAVCDDYAGTTEGPATG